MGLNSYVAIGRISKMNFKTVQVGEENLDICNITVPVNNWKPGRNGADPIESTLWCELTAFGHPDRKRKDNKGNEVPEYNQAQVWSNQFKEKDVVHISGTPEIKTYLKADGTPGASMILNDPTIGKVMGTQSANVDADQVAQKGLPF